MGSKAQEIKKKKLFLVYENRGWRLLYPLKSLLKTLKMGVYLCQSSSIMH